MITFSANQGSFFTNKYKYYHSIKRNKYKINTWTRGRLRLDLLLLENIYHFPFYGHLLPSIWRTVYVQSFRMKDKTSVSNCGCCNLKYSVLKCIFLLLLAGYYNYLWDIFTCFTIRTLSLSGTNSMHEFKRNIKSNSSFEICLLFSFFNILLDKLYLIFCKCIWKKFGHHHLVRKIRRKKKTCLFFSILIRYKNREK